VKIRTAGFSFAVKQWSGWSPWSGCPGCTITNTRTRSCSKPPFDFGGRACIVAETLQSTACYASCYGI